MAERWKITQDGKRIQNGFGDMAHVGGQISISNNGKYALIRVRVNRFSLLDINNRVILKVYPTTNVFRCTPQFSPDDQHVIIPNNDEISVYKMSDPTANESVFTVPHHISTTEGIDMPIIFTRWSLEAGSFVWLNNNEFAFAFYARIIKVNIRSKHIISISEDNINEKIHVIILDSKKQNLIYLVYRQARLNVVNIESREIVASKKFGTNGSIIHSFIMVSPTILVAYSYNDKELIKIEYPSLQQLKTTKISYHTDLSSLKRISDDAHFMLDDHVYDVETLMSVGTLDKHDTLKSSGYNNVCLDTTVTRNGTKLIKSFIKPSRIGIYNINPPFVYRPLENFNYFQSLMLSSRLKRRIPKHLMVIIAKYAFD